MKILLPLFIAVFVVGFLIGGTFFSKTVVREKEKPLRLLAPEDVRYSVIFAPAVDENGEGVLTEIGVSIEPGSGRTLTSIENILFFVDTQNSIRTAQDVAQELTGFDLSRHDIIYSITANASLIEGPSAGAAITIATIAALEDKQISPDVMITGTVGPDGTIGRVGQIQEKILAAKENGATLMLIPKQGGFPIGVEYERTIQCTITGGGKEICITEYVKKASSSSDLGIEIKEVSSIEEALPYFIGGGSE